VVSIPPRSHGSATGGPSLFDSHCHLTDAAFRDDLEEVLERARAAGVKAIVSIASSPPDTKAALALTQRSVPIWTTAGIHPHEADSGTREALAEVRDLLGRDEVVAVGECGLDYHYNHAPKPDQRRVFRAQVRLADDAGLPMVIHSRSCDEDMLAAVADFPEDVGGVLHCFTGADELLEAALERGLHVSFTGIVTFRNYAAAHQVAAVPGDRIMVETDEPAHVLRVAEAAAAIRGETLADFAESTNRNAREFYGVTIPIEHPG
jgi:TatD DNase family protein